ncbi:glycosyltransferase family 39 protein [Halodesulfovibrio sp. MK-HDV]|uniref:ArnT family glycosyltransferase n=1 Tax=Halodesulfovibrio sp. MK-HDV TaxID=2599925 RepID=UPI00136B653C|nr:glycosyltransferase family 39 protein [Halodesulfovibrio sp. MK-HDV]KAF1077843.1 Undecaprenyl phosphate-alpha-4-amino-4-deoxy-L-arabinose arabinosyl transferase [Halodesulfovibrio sp. MK-HDV]
MSMQRVCTYFEAKLRYRYVPLFLLGLLVIITTTTYLNQLDPDIMEGRNFITASEIVETGNWLVPRLFGELRIAKPPLPTWMTSAVMVLAGTDTNLFVNRIPSAFAGLFLAMAFFGLTKSVTGSSRISIISTAVLATSYLHIFMVRRGTWDIHAVAYMTAMIWALDVLLKSKEFRPWLCLLAGVLFGLSFLSKGPVAFYALLLPFLFSELVVNDAKKMGRQWKKLLLVTGCGVIISVSWYLVIMLMHPEAMAAMFSQETAAWAGRHVRVWWYYLPQVPAMLGLWAIPAVLVCIPMFAFSRLQDSIPYKKLLLWTLGIVVLLSIIPEKKVRYLLPVIIPLSMLVGGYLDYCLKRGFSFSGSRRIFQLYLVLGVIITLAAIGIIWSSGEITSPALAHDPSELLIVACYVLLAATLCVTYMCRKPNLLLGCVFGLVAFVLITTPPHIKTLLPKRGILPIQDVRSFVGKAEKTVHTLTSLKLQTQWVLGKPATRIVAKDLTTLSPGEHIVIAAYPTAFPKNVLVEKEYLARYIKRDPLLIYRVTVQN